MANFTKHAVRLPKKMVIAYLHATEVLGEILNPLGDSSEKDPKKADALTQPPSTESNLFDQIDIDHLQRDIQERVLTMIQKTTPFGLATLE